jgi:hypothetical protein
MTASPRQHRFRRPANWDIPDMPTTSQRILAGDASRPLEFVGRVSEA